MRLGKVTIILHRIYSLPQNVIHKPHPTLFTQSIEEGLFVPNFSGVSNTYAFWANAADEGHRPPLEPSCRFCVLAVHEETTNGGALAAKMHAPRRSPPIYISSSPSSPHWSPHDQPRKRCSRFKRAMLQAYRRLLERHHVADLKAQR